jgi:hypothetical protein
MYIVIGRLFARSSYKLYNILIYYTNFMHRRLRNTELIATNDWLMNKTRTQRQAKTNSCSGILHDALRKTTNIFSHNNKCPGRNSYRTAAELKPSGIHSRQDNLLYCVLVMANCYLMIVLVL